MPQGLTVGKVVDRGKEVWKPIKGYVGMYEVSSYGKIRGLDRKIAGRYKGFYKNFKGIILRQRKCSNGYRDVKLCKSNIRKDIKIHKLVAQAFISNHPTGMDINHKDCDKSNNFVLNLEYVTRSENMIHAYKNGLRKSVLNKKQVLRIRELYFEKNYFKNFQKELSKKFNVSRKTIWCIVKNRTWKYI
ncbi:MAG: NUMOD4 domain-containing protein [Patescibacteria group bacterium]